MYIYLIFIDRLWRMDFIFSYSCTILNISNEWNRSQRSKHCKNRFIQNQPCLFHELCNFTNRTCDMSTFHCTFQFRCHRWKDFGFVLFCFSFVFLQAELSNRQLSRVVQSPIKLTQDFDLSFVTFRWGFLFILFGLLFWVWVISNYTKHKPWKTFLYQNIYTSVNF